MKISWGAEDLFEGVTEAKLIEIAWAVNEWSLPAKSIFNQHDEPGDTFQIINS
ncbi:MAG: hypothetical protein V3V52_14065 [Candidatus Adiutricales bacterium]